MQSFVSLWFKWLACSKCQWLSSLFSREKLSSSPEPWWMRRGDFSQPECLTENSIKFVQPDNEDESVSGSYPKHLKKNAAQFSNYSLSSSVVPRCKGTKCLL